LAFDIADGLMRPLALPAPQLKDGQSVFRP
jgi:hypothetical protein